MILGLPRDSAEAGVALGLLQAWDGRLTVDSAAATVYELFVAEMCNRLAQAKAPRTYRWILGESVSVLTAYNFWAFRRTNHLSRLLRSQPAGWFARSWPAEMTDVLAMVIRPLKKDYGPNPEHWGWGRLRPLVVTHALGRRGGWLGRVFNLGPVPCGGDTNTINQASAMPLRPLAPPKTSPPCGSSSTSATGGKVGSCCRAANPATRCRRTTRTSLHSGSGVRACPSPGRRTRCGRQRCKRWS